MIEKGDIFSLGAMDAAVVMTEDSVRIVTPDASQHAGQDLPPQVAMALAVTMLTIYDAEWVEETMQRFDAMLESIPDSEKH